MQNNQKELVALVQKDKKYFELIYDAYYQPVLTYVYKRIGSIALAQDVTSEVFIKAYLKFYTFKWKGIDIDHWIFRIATNETNLYFRSTKKYKPQSLIELYSNKTVTASEPDIEQERETMGMELQLDQEFKEVQKALSQLPVKYQEVIAMKYFEGFRTKKIASILSKKKGTVKSLLSRGLSKLRSLL